MKSYKTFTEAIIRYQQKTPAHEVIDPVTHKKIRVPKGFAVQKGKSSSSGGNGDSGNGNGGNGNGD